MYLFQVVLKYRGYQKIVPEAREKHVLYHGPGSDVRVLFCPGLGRGFFIVDG
jgi:hypothetical protein